MDLMISSLLCFIRVLIIISMVDLSHVSFISSPIFHPSLTHLLLSWWSPNNGQQIIGTPASMLSKTEFQPLWVKTHLLLSGLEHLLVEPNLQQISFLLWPPQAPSGSCHPFSHLQSYHVVSPIKMTRHCWLDHTKTPTIDYVSPLLCFRS